MISIAIVTISDRSYQGIRIDSSGPAIKKWVESKGYTVVNECIIPDDYDVIRKTLIDYSTKNVNIIITTGGTGVALRDVTPEATLSVVDRIIPGIAEVMRSKSLDITPHAMLTRGVAGIRNMSIIINLPGNPKAVVENLGFIENALPHAVGILTGNVTE